MPDLGKYALEVVLAYGVTLALLAGLVLVSVASSRRAARDLRAAEERAASHED